jgi:hypothetical protein
MRWLPWIDMSLLSILMYWTLPKHKEFIQFDDISSPTFYKKILEDLTVYITNKYHPLSFIKKAWLEWLVFSQCVLVVFPNKHLSNEVILIMVNKIMEWHVFITLVETIMITTYLTFGCHKMDLTFLFLWLIILTNN